MELSNRLKAVAGLVTKGNVVCDVGCDHGYVSIYLIQQKISPRVLAMDVRKGPLDGAREHIRRSGLEDRIAVRLSDGVEKLQKNEADTLLLAGMGGRLMAEILTRGEEKILDMKECILQPQSEIPAFRRYLREKGYQVTAEDMILEEGKYYPMMRVIPPRAAQTDAGAITDTDTDVWMAPGAQTNTDTQTDTDTQPESDARAASDQTLLYDRYGEGLLKAKHPVLEQYLKDERKKLLKLEETLQQKAAVSKKGSDRLPQIREELRMNGQALESFGQK